MGEVEIGVLQFRIEALERGQSEVKASVAGIDGKISLTHDGLVKLMAAPPGQAPWCVQHQARLDRMETSIAELQSNTSTRLRHLEITQWKAMGIIAAVVFVAQILPLLVTVLRHAPAK